MKTNSWFGLVLFLSTSIVSGETNTPYPSGTNVSITSSAGTVTGRLQDVNFPQWLSILEANSTEPTFVRGTELILRRVNLSLESRRFERRALERTLSGRLPARRFAERSALDEATGGHYIYGRPKTTDDRFKFRPQGHTEDVSGMTILIREAFTLGHYDKMKGPAWVAVRWTRQNFEDGEGLALDRPPFEEDDELPYYAQGGTNFNFAQTQMERGHMCPDNDLDSFGEDAIAEGMKMSNVIPQRKGRNHVVWGRLEKLTHNIVNESDIDTIWILSGPIYAENPQDIKFLGNHKAIPKATYKIVAWKGSEEDLHVRAYIIAQQDTDVDLVNYLDSVDEVESRTGLDFFSQLEDSEENPLEAAVPTTLWE